MILVLRLRGVATEAIKNMVLAGIGKLIVVDAEDVHEEDLGCGFFFRDEDVGRKVRTRRKVFGSGYSMVLCRDIFVSRGLTSLGRELKA